jgi:U3 small nucleolar RNA-associated protein 15
MPHFRRLAARRSKAQAQIRGSDNSLTMATAPVGPLPQMKLPAGPSPISAEQRYWKQFKNQLLLPSPTSSAITHISSLSSVFGSASSAGSDSFAVTTGTRVQIYSSRTRKLVKTITRFGDIARSGEIRKDGRVLVAGEDTGRIQVFDVSSRAILKTWLTHKQPVWTTKFSPTELTTLLSASDDKTVRLWDLPSNEPVTTFVGHGDYVRCADFMPGTMAGMVISGSYDSTVKLWDPRAGKTSAVMTFKHSAPVEDVLSLQSGTTVLAAAEHTISVLDLVAARPRHMISNHQKTVTSLCLASGGKRLVSGGLDGHVKVFETTGWNVVSSTKYTSPVLSVRVIPTPDSSDAGSDDRHLVVGLQSGVLSIKTRLSAAEAEKAKEREKEMAALVAGTIDQLDAKKASKKRRIDASRRLDFIGEGADVVIANEPRLVKKKERPWQRDLRHGKYSAALDQVLDKQNPEHSHLNVLTLLYALRHRSAMRSALEGRNETTVQPILKWICGHIMDPRYISVCVEAGMQLIDLYAEYVPESEELHELFKTLRRRVDMETERAQMACQTAGMLESVLLAAI